MKANSMIDVPSTRLEKSIHIITYTLLGLLYLFVTLQYNSLPEQIPAHYNFTGELKVTEENAEPVYKEGRLMLASLALFLVLFMVF